MQKGLNFVILKTAALVLIGVWMIAPISCRSGSQQKAETEKPTKGEAMQVVTSKDGTKIAYDKTGQGPAIILVNGALATRADHTELAQLLSPHLTVYNYDRRGRGNSGDNQQYTVEREIEDIEALIKEAGDSVYIYGISSGACLAFEAAAALGDKIKKLAMYEAPYDEAEGTAEKYKEYKSKFEELIAKGQRSEAVEWHLKYTGAPDKMIAEMKASPAWPGFEAMAPTIAYDIAALGKDRSIPVERAAKVKATALVMVGGASAEAMPFMRPSAEKLARTIPNAQYRSIEGQKHDLSSKVLAPILVEFFVKN